ncbi:MAG: hypothetical protein MPJ50_12425 [Pirellulales bacterium]|nr:hypothetical protein [Pirellulales bacterium]
MMQESAEHGSQRSLPAMRVLSENHLAEQRESFLVDPLLFEVPQDVA